MKLEVPPSPKLEPPALRSRNLQLAKQEVPPSISELPASMLEGGASSFAKVELPASRSRRFPFRWRRNFRLHWRPMLSLTVKYIVMNLWLLVKRFEPMLQNAESIKTYSCHKRFCTLFLLNIVGGKWLAYEGLGWDQLFKVTWWLLLDEVLQQW